jgi:hypothetical protein
MAVGLGDVELKSHLGEKLLVKVIVTDIELPTDSNCFSAIDISDTPAFKKTNVTLQSNNTGHQLIITTNDLVTEPIINLRLAFQCDPNVNHDYVLLLDPSPFKIIEKTSIEDEAYSKADNTASSKKEAHLTVNKKSSSLVAEKTNGLAFKKTYKKKKTNDNSSVEEKLNSTYTGKQTFKAKLNSNPAVENKNYPIQANGQPSSDKPFLVISGGSSNSSNDKTGLSLRLATEIDFTRPAPVAVSPSAIDTSDEVTVMTNRLTHLEKQITSLQKRNMQLVADAAKAKEENDATNWPKILLIALAIIAALAGIEWLRRKVLTKRSNNEIAEWFDAEAEINPTRDTSKPADLNFEANSSTGDFDEQLGQGSISNSAKSVTSFEILDHESVLDEANVFIEHGRPTLAIQLLQNHLSEAPAESPEIWLKLLNLLAKESSETNYDEAVVECNKYFNIKAAKFGDDSEQHVASIEDYPHIITRIEGAWGSQHATGVLNDIIYNKRSQPRGGIEQGAFDDLFFLKMIAKYIDTFPMGQGTFMQPSPLVKLDAENPTTEVLLTDHESVDDIETSPISKQNIIEFDATEATSTEDNALETIDFNLPEYDSPALEVDESFEAEEINFTAVAEEIEITASPEMQVQALEFDQNADSATSPKTLKSKAKTQAASSPKKKNELNDIEWDLSDIKPKSDQ